MLLHKLEFILVLALLVLPPILFQAAGSLAVLTFAYPPQTFFLALVALLIYMQNRNVHLIRFQGRWSFFRILVFSGESFLAFGILCVVSAVLEFSGHFFSVESELKIVRPERFNDFAIFFIGTFCAAFYEEVLYRMYLPEAMKHLCVGWKKVPEFFLKWGPEFLAVVLFALGHIYLGRLGFLNALLCGIALRRCVLKTHSLWFSLIPHFAYNALIFLAVSRILE